MGTHNYWSVTTVWQGYRFISIFELGRLWACLHTLYTCTINGVNLTACRPTIITHIHLHTHIHVKCIYLASGTQLNMKHGIQTQTAQLQALYKN